MCREPRVFTSDRFSALRGQLSPGKLVDVQNVSIQAVPAPPEHRAAHGPRPRVDGPARRACVRSLTTARFTRTRQQRRNNPGLHHSAAGQQIWTLTPWCRRGQFHTGQSWLSRAARSEQTDSASFVGGGFQRACSTRRLTPSPRLRTVPIGTVTDSPFSSRYGSSPLSWMVVPLVERRSVTRASLEPAGSMSR